MAARKREILDEGAILDPAFIEHYWRVARSPARWGARRLAARMRRLGVARCAFVLDVGCGPAWTTRYLAEHFPAMRFVALDLSEPMIRRAAQAAGGDDLPPNLRFVVGDGCRLPFDRARFDLVLSSATLHHVADPVAFFDEVDRVLSPDGRVIIADLDRDLSVLLRPLVALVDWIERRSRQSKAARFRDGIARSFRAAYTCQEISRVLQSSSLGRRATCRRGPFQYRIETPAPRRRRRCGRWFAQGVGGHDPR